MTTRERGDNMERWERGQLQMTATINLTRYLTCCLTVILTVFMSASFTKQPRLTWMTATIIEMMKTMINVIHYEDNDKCEMLKHMCNNVKNSHFVSIMSS